MLFKKKKPVITKTDSRLDTVAIICDGNGRWATKRGLARPAGHVAGAKRIQPVLEKFRELGVHKVILYIFSTENWKRPTEEVDTIMKLIYKYLDDVVIPMIKNDPEFCIKFIGDKSGIPEPLRSKCIECEQMAAGRPFECSVALNYGGRAEIVNAANAAIKAGVSELTEESFKEFLYTSPTPDPDLVIRTGGDFRVSNFLLWQSAYAEYVFLDTLWPDFGEKEIIQSIQSFDSRKRRFGGLDKEDTEKK